MWNQTPGTVMSHFSDLNFNDLQHIYQMEMLQESEKVRSMLTFEVARRAMINARKATIPTSPNTIEEVIESLEERRHPPLYQDMYAGHVKHHVPASEYP